MTPLRTLRTARYAVRDLCLIASYVSGAIACAGIAKAVWMLIHVVASKDAQ